MAHIVLLGDSIFDNKSYVGATGKDVITHLRAALPDNWQATLRAIDGSLIENVSKQSVNLPADATHLIVSVGGNNALMNADFLQMKADNSAEVLNELAARRDVFEAQYKEMLRELLSKNMSMAVCTVYFPNFPEAFFQRLAMTALAVFNDAIIRQAIINNLPVIDLRIICNEADDYANAIEPSDKGGKKIAAKILELINEHEFSKDRTQIFV